MTFGEWRRSQGATPPQYSVGETIQLAERAWAAATATERERCAKLADEIENPLDDPGEGKAWDDACQAVADAIRSGT